MCQQIRSNMACSTAGRFWRGASRDKFDIIVVHELLLLPDSFVPRCEFKNPRTANSPKSTAGQRGLIKTWQSSFVICVCSIRHLSFTSTCFFGSGPIYVWTRPLCISPSAPPSEKPRPDLPTSTVNPSVKSEKGSEQLGLGVNSTTMGTRILKGVVQRL